MIHTNTLTNDRSCSHVCMDICTCVYVCYSMYVYVCIYIAHLHIDAAVLRTMFVYNVHAQRHMCTCTTIRTHTHARVDAHVVVSIWMCVRVYMCVTNARGRVCVYIHLYHTST